MTATDPRAATPMIKAIETSYAGCRFRSRIEARWAVFLDHLGIEWQYEPQGFELPSGRYLPDFWLPGLKAWIEVKGAEPDDSEEARIIDLARAVCGSGHRVHMLIGDIPRCTPACRLGAVIPAMTVVPYWAIDESPRVYTMPPEEFAGALPEDWIMLDGTWQPGPDRQRINAALTAARSARFEHGQHGA